MFIKTFINVMINNKIIKKPFILSSDIMVKANKGIKCKDRNYAIYKIGNWKNDYKINVIGTSTEIPITSPTKHHVELNMEQIRSSSFEFNGKEVNGMVGLAIQLNPSLIDENIDELVKLEEKEFNLISEELNNLELKKDNEEIDPNSFEYLIYHLVYEGHNLTSKPANDFTREYHITEIKRLKELSGN